MESLKERLLKSVAEDPIYKGKCSYCGEYASAHDRMCIWLLVREASEALGVSPPADLDVVWSVEQIKAQCARVLAGDSPNGGLLKAFAAFVFHETEALSKSLQASAGVSPSGDPLYSDRVCPQCRQRFIAPPASPSLPREGEKTEM